MAALPEIAPTLLLLEIVYLVGLPSARGRTFAILKLV
jgi:hypothetical protein